MRSGFSAVGEGPPGARFGLVPQQRSGPLANLMAAPVPALAGRLRRASPGAGAPGSQQTLAAEAAARDRRRSTEDPSRGWQTGPADPVRAGRQVARGGNDD
jgi:hypothetical protein